ncbi:unnamed protein product [Ilex paraguariensis]|uniref:Uncharacterized protein n=1 Tax=Ilex paraguariensis TaxID=185542 RepID=A0ABC8SY70_9AQUA
MYWSLNRTGCLECYKRRFQAFLPKFIHLCLCFSSSPTRRLLFNSDSSTPFFDSDSSISFFDSQAHSTTTNIRLFRYGFIFGRESASARKPSPHSSIDNFLASLYLLVC